MWQYLNPHVLTVRIRTDLATSAAVALYVKFAVLLPFYSLFDLRLSLLYLLFYLRAPPLYRFLCLVLHPLDLLVHLLLYLLLHSPARRCPQRRNESDHEQDAERSLHPSPCLIARRGQVGLSL